MNKPPHAERETRPRSPEALSANSISRGQEEPAKLTVIVSMSGRGAAQRARALCVIWEGGRCYSFAARLRNWLKRQGHTRISAEVVSEIANRIDESNKLRCWKELRVSTGAPLASLTKDWVSRFPLVRDVFRKLVTCLLPLCSTHKHSSRRTQSSARCT